jgi:hypothetical protein
MQCVTFCDLVLTVMLLRLLCFSVSFMIATVCLSIHQLILGFPVYSHQLIGNLDCFHFLVSNDIVNILCTFLCGCLF